MKFLQFSDLHLRPAGQLAYGVVDSNKNARTACEAAHALGTKIDAVILSGDLTDCGLAAEYAQLRDVVDALSPMPVFLAAGNHDRRDVMLAELPALSENGGFIQYAVEDFGVRLVVLDTVVPGATHGELCQARLDWLQKTLTASPGRETMIAMHHPPFLTGIPQFDGTALRNMESFRSIIAANPQVTRIICGHHHRFAFGTVAQAIAIVAPATSYQFMLLHDPAAEEGFTLEPSAILLHSWTPRQGFVTQEVFTESYPGPFQVRPEAEYPGQ